MTTNDLAYQRKYISKYKNTYFGSYSVKISDIKRKGRFYYKLTPLQMTLTTHDFINITYKFNGCACCGSNDNIIPCLIIKLCNGGLVNPDNTLPLCKECTSSYHHKIRLSFEYWYPRYKYFDKDRYNKIIQYVNSYRNSQYYLK